MSPTQIAAAVERGSLVRMGRGVFARAEVARQYLDRDGGEHLIRAIAALAVTGPGAVVSHHSAARLQRSDLLGRPPTADGRIADLLACAGLAQQSRHQRPSH